MWGAPSWTVPRDAKLAERAARLAYGTELVLAHPIPSSLTSAILRASVPQLVDGIRTKAWTASQVLLVFVARTLAVQEACNPVTEVLFESAWKEAQRLDADFGKTGTIVGPLHGVPVSFKDQFHIAGQDSTIGFTHATNQPALLDAPLVSLVRSAGGIPFVKTNVPQTMLAFACANPLFGTTENPFVPGRIPGGSTGGEAVLLSADASPLGFGSDIGGSLRIPAALSGCFSLKPCSARFPDGGTRGANIGFEAVKTSIGPMGRSVDDLEVATRLVLDSSEELAKTGGTMPLKWRDVKLPKKLKFGYYLTDGLCRASPAVRRAIMETVEALRKKGHEVVEIELPNPIKCMELFVALTSSDGYRTLLSGLLGDPQEPSLFLVTFGTKLPSFLRTFACWVVEKWVGDVEFATLFRASRPKSVGEMQAWQFQRAEYVKMFREFVWVQLALDGIICAPQATPALKHTETWNLSPLAISTIIYNVVDSTVGIVPVTFVDSEKDALSSDFLTKGDVVPGSKLIENRVYGRDGVYDAQDMQGLPVAVQVVGGYCEEEKVLGMMRVIDDALGPRGFGPGEYVKTEAQR